MKQLRIKNHYVPECYLKRWSDLDGKIYTYKIIVPHSNVPFWKKFYSASIAYQRYLYTTMISGSMSDDLEVWLSVNFESPANNSLERATSDQRLTRDDWHKLIKFLASQDVRTPARLSDYLKKSQEKVPQILEEVLSGLPEKLENGLSIESEPIGIESALEAFPLKVTTRVKDGENMGYLEAKTYVGRSTWIYGIRHLLTKTSEHLHTHKWSILKPAKGYYWPTSDNPVVKVNYYSEGNYDLNGGWANKKGNIIFPIGPEHALFVQIGDKPMPKGKRLSVSLTKKIIKLICENAHRKIFSIKCDDGILQYRSRAIDPAFLQKEKYEIEKWNRENLEKELEYFQNN